MILEQFYLGCLAHASYLIGSEGVAAVVDPQRDVRIYLDAARQQGLGIAHIIETHLHADFVSGHQELAQSTGAAIYLGEGSGATFPHRAVRDGDEIEFGKCRLRFLQTPGHTLESISVVVMDAESGNDPQAVLTGDTLFIGDVGRPDLSDTHTPQQLAGLLYDSLHHKLLGLPDSVKVYPAHGAGSMCGRNISADRNSTMGRERLTNYALQPMTRERFVEVMTQDLPARPEYFQRDVDVNRHGAAALESLPPVAVLSPEEVFKRQRQGAAVLDTRAATPYCSAHVPGSIQIGLGGQFAAWAGAVLGLDRDLILVAEDDQAAEEARLRLARVGIERVVGRLRDGIAGWAHAGLALAEIGQIAVQDLREEMAQDPELAVVDVRRQAEWNQGHIAGALLLPLDQIGKSTAPLDPEKLTAVHCKSGYRSAIACSLLEARGFQKVMNVLGGYDAWVGAGLPSES
ncbi:Beta-lactamase domain protein [Candidatus Sulfopaludibacter sp. SbA4]|nr:Beta-lactamase domain protein [Candidatus Sulfopaludibacter sp. SbA4]